MAVLRSLLIKASQSEALERQITTRSLTRALALRYIAGEHLDDGLRVARELVAQGKTVTLDYLGEAVTAPDEARAASKVVLEALDRIGQEGLPAGLSVKPTQMGLGMAGDRHAELSRELLSDIAAASDRIGADLTLDMEGSDVTEATVALVEELHGSGHHNVGCAVQTYLHRTRDDCKRLSAIQASLRLCKGAYAEPPDIAYQSGLEVDRSFADCADYLLAHGTYPRIATHDARLQEYVKRAVARLGLGRDAFEFQMLYGVRPTLQDALVREGYRLRIYVPFGDQWFPYFMRRLAERPANLLFFLRSLRDT